MTITVVDFVPVAPAMGDYDHSRSKTQFVTYVWIDLRRLDSTKWKL